MLSFPGAATMIMHVFSSAALRVVLSAGFAFLLCGCVAQRSPAPPPAADATPRTGGGITTAQVFSPVLGRDIFYELYLPDGYAAAGPARFPVLYLLHGRGNSMAAWRTIKPDLDRLIASREIPPLIAVLPDAPSSRRAGYYIDSRSDDGERVETAFTTDLIRHIDAKHRTQPERSGRVVAGYSMGGYGALRYALAHPELFGAAIVLSPAVYSPLPPRDSSAREFGAFGKGAARFDESIYHEKNYPALLPAFAAKRLQLAIFIAVGDDERPVADPAEAAHDLDYEAHTLYNKLRRVPGIVAQLRVVDGGHDWETWRPAFIEGVRYVFRQWPPPTDSAKPTR